MKDKQACGAGESIKRGVQRSGTPGTRPRARGVGGSL